MDDQLEKIKRAYDLAARKYRAGIDPVTEIPEEFRSSKEFKEFFERAAKGATNSGAGGIREFLDPREGMKLLDAGCCANLTGYRFDRWPCRYYGVDISPEIISVMRAFAEKEGLALGGLEVAELSRLPFDDDFFDLAMAIGVLAYYDLDYVGRALAELKRVLKAGARMVVDVPNPDHPHLDTMFEFEALLGMPNVAKPRAEFERLLCSMFTIEMADDSEVMIKYFVRR